MADLDPLKFKVAIQDEATKELERIEKEFLKLNDKTITVKVEGLADLQHLLSALQHTQVQNIGKEVSVGIRSATEGLQESAQKAIRDSLGQLATDLTAVKTAIQNDNFTAFSQRIEKCAEAVNTLDAAFKQFHVTIGQDDGLKNFMTGLGEVVRNVRTTMGQLNGFGQERASGINVYERNVQRMEDALYRLSEARQKVISSISIGKEAGMDVSAWEKYLQILNAYTKKLQEIRSDPEMMNGKGWQADAFGSVFKHLVGNASDAERQVSVFVRQMERLKEAREKAMGMTTESAAQGQVKLLGINSKDTKEVEKRIDYLTDRLKELGRAINETMALQSKHPNEGTLKGIQGMISEYDALKRELDALYVSYQKVSSLTDSIDGKSLGLGHIKGYTGPMTSLDENQWLALKRQAEIQEVAGEAAQRHQRKLEELTNAFAQHDAQVAKSQRVQEGDNKARQESAAALRKQAQELVKARMEMLRTQSADLGKLLSMGRGVLGSEQYDAVRNALRGVREEMRQIEGVMQRMDSYSTRSLFAVGRGTTPDYAPLISSTQKLIAAKEQATQASHQMTVAEQQLAQALNHTTQAAYGQSQVLSDLKSMAMQYLSVWGGQQFVNNIIETGGLLEQQRLSIGAILGDMEQATTLFGQIKSLAIKSPFGVVELDRMSKQLTAYGFEYKELYDWTKRLADISAATGTEVSRLSLALGHVRSEGALSGYTLRQFAMANVPVLRMLSENLAITTKEVRERVRKKEISYDDVTKVLKQLTDEGGMFYQAQETMSQALNAKFKNLRDAFSIMYGEIAEGGVGDALKKLAEGLTNMAKDWEHVGRAVIVAAGTFGVMRTATLLTNTAIGENTVSALANVRATIQQNNAYLRLARASGILTKEQYAAAVSHGRYSVAGLKVALVTEKLTVEELQRAVALGRVNKEVALQAVTQAEATGAIKAGSAAVIQQTNVLKGFRKGWFLFAEGARTAGAAVKSLLASLWPMLAISAVFEVFNRAKTQRDDAMEAAGNAAKSTMKEYEGLRNMNERLGESEGKKKDELKKGIAEMEKALSASGRLTPELKKQESGVKTLAGKYDLLRQALRGAAEDFDDLQARLAMAGSDAMEAGGGLFTDNMLKDLEQYNKSEMRMRNAFASSDKGLRDSLKRYMSFLGIWNDSYEGMSAPQLFDKMSGTQKAGWVTYKDSEKGSEAVIAAKKAYRDYIGKNADVSGEQGAEWARKMKNYVDILKPGIDWSELTTEDKIAADKAVRKFLDGFEFSNATKEKARQLFVDNVLGGSVPDYVQEVTNELNENFDGGDDGDDGDANAKKLREKVRILREAEESYQYWRKQVGSSGAEAHVNEEFGKILGELGYNFDNIEAYRTTLEELRAEYEKKPQSKEMLEALKELDKLLADIGRKDFEKLSEEAMSGMKKQLDDLTRAWEIYNSVLESSGDAALATRVSGVSYGATAADLKRTALSDYAGIGIDFNSVLGMSEEEIDRYVEGLGVSEKKIKAIQDGLKEWKKAQQEVEKSDIISYAQWLGTLVDYESQRVRLQNEYNDALELTNRLLKAGVITEEEARRRNFYAEVKRETGEKEMEGWYARLYNSSQEMARSEFADAYAKEMKNLDRQLAVGIINLEQYADKVKNLSGIATAFRTDGVLGVRGGVGAFLSGGVQGLQGYYQIMANDAIYRAGKVTPESEKWQKLADGLENATSNADKVAEAFSWVGEKANMLGDMFDALGMEDSANAFRDAGSVLGGIASGASSLSALGVWGMAAGAVIGGVTAIAKVHDERLDRQIAQLDKDVQSIESNTELIKLFRSRQLGYDNGAMKWRMAASTLKSGGALAGGYEEFSKAQRAMYGYYIKNSVSSGYAQEYANLIAERQKEIEGLDKLLSKNKKDTSAIEEAKKKIAELDEQILYFGEDLAKELWGIDLKSWADQIGDVLMNAFENGENAAKAYEDTVRSIMQNVTSEVLKVGILEPMMENLRERLFGKLDENGKRTGGVVSTDMMASNPAAAAKLMVTTVGEFFQPGGEGSNMVTAAQEVYTGINDLLKQMGYSSGLMNPDTSSTLSASVRGMSEETSDLLAGYVNALRQDVAADRLLFSQFVSQLWPEYVESFARNATAVANIDNNVRAIMEMMESGRGRMYEEIEAVGLRLDRVIDGFDSFAIRQR